MKIDQIYIRAGLRSTFTYKMMAQTHNLKSYHSLDKPAFFYGIWTWDKNCMKTIKNHRSTKIIIWTGADIWYKKSNGAQQNLKLIRGLKDVRHIAISSFIQRDLEQLKWPFRFIPFMGMEFTRYQPVKKGPCIYIYTSLSSPGKYGSGLYQRLIKEFPDIKFHITARFGSKGPVRSYSKSQIANIYSQCFLGLRLTQHDGLAATVQELGLMGIKCIHNGSSPSSIPYKTYDDLVEIIKRESATIGTIDHQLANQVKQYLTLDPAVYDTDYYEPDTTI